MDNLLSGTIGAILGSLISIFYVHFIERLKSRRQLAIDIIDHVETMYHRLMALGSIEIPELAERRQQSGLTLLNDDERRQYVAEFLRLLTTYSPFAKIDIIFDDKELSSTLERLTKGFQSAFHKIKNKSEFMDLLNSEVDPHYQKLCVLLRGKTKLFHMF